MRRVDPAGQRPNPTASRICWLLALVAAPAAVAAQFPGAVPFGVGEQLTYAVHGAKLGAGGHATMTLSGPVDVHDTPTILATFTVSVHLALFLNASAVSRSWIDPVRFGSLQFSKDEHRPFSSSSDSVEMYPAARRWIEVGHDSGTMTTGRPLDELSFMYWLRTLPLVPDTLYSVNRFYDPDRSPTTVHVAAHDTVLDTPAGTFSTVELDMVVKDPSLDHGTGLIRVWVSDDVRRLPVRIQSAMPGIGTGTFTLTSVIPGAGNLADSMRSASSFRSSP